MGRVLSGGVGSSSTTQTINVNNVANTLSQVAQLDSSLYERAGYLGVFGQGKFKVFSQSGTFTVPDGVTSVRVRVLGAGGGAISIDSGILNRCIATGGGGGGYACGVFTVTPASAIPVTVGTGGSLVRVAAADAVTYSSSASGGDGGTSSFGGVIQATGGKGGSLFNSSAAAITSFSLSGGIGGIGSGGTIINSNGGSGSGVSNITLVSSQIINFLGAGGGAGSQLGNGDSALTLKNVSMSSLGVSTILRMAAFGGSVGGHSFIVDGSTDTSFMSMITTNGNNFISPTKANSPFEKSTKMSSMAGGGVIFTGGYDIFGDMYANFYATSTYPKYKSLQIGNGPFPGFWFVGGSFQGMTGAFGSPSFSINSSYPETILDGSVVSPTFYSVSYPTYNILRTGNFTGQSVGYTGSSIASPFPSSFGGGLAFSYGANSPDPGFYGVRAGSGLVVVEW